jgi:hypothetical protein
MSLLASVCHPQAALCLSDRSLHRFDQAIYFLSTPGHKFVPGYVLTTLISPLKRVTSLSSSCSTV